LRSTRTSQNHEAAYASPRDGRKRQLANRDPLAPPPLKRPKEVGRGGDDISGISAVLIDRDGTFHWTNGDSAPIVSGLNVLPVSTSASAAPAIVDLAATLNNDGTVNAVGRQGTGALLRRVAPR
jgi:hypothetical protein